MSEEKCPITGIACQISADAGDANIVLVSYPEAGGDYRIAEDAREALRNNSLTEEARICLAAWIAEAHLLHDNTPLVDAKVAESARGWKIPPVPERLNRALFWMVRRVSVGEYMPTGKMENILGDEIKMDTPGFSAYCYISQAKEKSRDEVQFFLLSLSDLGLIDSHTVGNHPWPRTVLGWRLTAKGYERYEELQKTQGNSDSAFVAMWFHKSTNTVYTKAIEPAIESAGYKPIRIDQKDHSNKIDDEIIAEIRRARFVVADFTSQSADKPRGGVYYEAGFAHGLNLPVIFACRADILDGLHFDIRQYNFIRWSPDGLPEFKRELQTRIEAVIGGGPHKVD